MKNPDFSQPLPFGNRQQTNDLLREICVIASTSLGVSRDRPAIQQSDADDEEDLHDRLQALRQALGRIGWVADVALRRLGDPGCFADAEDWMLPGV